MWLEASRSFHGFYSTTKGIQYRRKYGSSMTFNANKYSVRSQDDGVPVDCILLRYEPRPSFNFECPSKGCIIHRCRGEKPTKLEICQTLGVNTCAEPSSRVPECRISVVSVNPSNDNHARIVSNLLDCINRKGDRSDMKSTVNFLTALMRQTYSQR